ncbi:MAG TPA: hypothetical protein VNL91_05530 [Thermoanaerobaculia bacterium]|nr:hypothetical protein [Thermoanaerobaculia bacterium]
MEAPRPSFLWQIVAAVTIVFAVLFASLPETVEAVSTRRSRLGAPREATFRGKQVGQRPLLVGVWLVIVVPLAGWAVTVTRRASR